MPNRGHNNILSGNEREFFKWVVVLVKGIVEVLVYFCINDMITIIYVLYLVVELMAPTFICDRIYLTVYYILNVGVWNHL